MGLRQRPRGRLRVSTEDPRLSEARRLIAQGGVKVDGQVATELDVERGRLAGATVQAGKRRFVRLHDS